MHVYFISHHFFLAYLLNIRLTKLRISFLLFKKKKKKTDFRAFKKKLDKKKYIHFAKWTIFHLVQNTKKA